MKEYKVIGKSLPIDKAVGIATGKLKYCSDYHGVEMLHVKLKPSEITHGKILAIHTEHALEVPGVKAIYTCFNTPLRKYDRGRVEPWEEVPNQERLFDNHIRFRGERVAAVVADSIESAIRACDLLIIDYEELPSVVLMQEAKQNDAITLHPEGNVYSVQDYYYGDYYDASYKYLHESKSHIGRMTHLSMETQSCRAIYDCASEKITIWSGCQSVFAVRNSVAQFLGMNFSKVRVVKCPMGGSFGVKQETLLEPLVAYIAKDLEADIKLVYSREEQIINTMMKHSLDGRVESKIDENGKIIGFSISCDLDAGAYLTVSKGYASTMGKKLGKVYKAPNIHFSGSAICTNTPINGSFRSWGSCEVALLLENHWNMVARKLNIDPIEFRLKNILAPGDIDVCNRVTVGNVRFFDCLVKGKERFSWDTKKENCRTKNQQQKRYRYGIGVSITSHTSSFYPYRITISSAAVRIQEDGSLIVNIAIHDHGCGTVLAMKKIVSEVMEIGLERIELNEADSQINLYDFGCYASRTVYTLGSALKKCCEQLLEKATEVAAIALQCHRSTIRYKDGDFSCEMDLDKRLTMAQVVQYSIQILGIDLYNVYTENAKENPGVAAAHFTEVEVDCYSGMVKILNCLSVHDIGKAINPDLCRGQVGSGIQQGIGMALREEITIHPISGKTLITNLKNYENVNSWDMPNYDVLFIEEPQPNAPYDAKSLGEVVLPAVAPAIVGAVNDALSMNLTHLPLTPAVILEALEEVDKC